MDNKKPNKLLRAKNLMMLAVLAIVCALFYGLTIVKLKGL